MVDNTSNVPVEAFTVGYYLSADESVGAGDINLSRTDITSMTPFEHSYIEGVTLQMPGTSPNPDNSDWFILAVADSQDPDPAGSDSG